MKQVNIEIEDKELAELGVDQEVRYAPFRFNDSQFIGYWISHYTDETKLPVIFFYVGSQTFNCRATQKNIDIFESILNKE
jgi:hypothetical protein